LLWSSEWSAADEPALTVKFVPPTIAYGNVYLATFSESDLSGELAMYGVRNTQSSVWFDITKAGLQQTGWGFADTNTIPWARAARAGYGFCAGKGFVGGQLNGYQAFGYEGFEVLGVSRTGVICNGTNEARHYDSTLAERRGSAWSFADVNKVGWAQASRLANEYCNARKHAGGQFNGQQTRPNGTIGIVCYDGTWYDAPKSQVTLSSSDLNLTAWGDGARAANDWCISRRHTLGGRFNGWQSPTSFGVVCYPK
jgi:hypothetical protein